MVAAPLSGTFELDALVWVQDPERVWRPGRVTSATEGEICIQLEAVDDEDTEAELGIVKISDPKTSSPRRSQLLRRNAVLVGDGAMHYNNLTEVPELHEAAVLHALDVRFSKGMIYTLTGPVLLAVNPFRTLPGLYSQDVLRSFAFDRQPGANKLPHVFGLAAKALQGIRERYESQTVLISGESGAGKTETTKFVMQFLALAGAERDAAQAKSEAEASGSMSARNLTRGMSRVERQVLCSNPLLEAFGNAQTLRNDNSSRFGKYIELQFACPEHLGDEAANPNLVGARIRTYLLEKVRVINQKEGERSFHIFYQALAAASPDADSLASPLAGGSPGRAELSLDGFRSYSAESFAYLRHGDKSSRASDPEAFEETLGAMRAIGLAAAEVSSIFRALAAVLHLGNISFRPLNTESCEVEEASTDENPPLDVVCELLGVKRADLLAALVSRTRQVPGEQLIRSPCNAEAATSSRDALARHLYHAIFSYLVQRTNASIGFQENLSFCGVLDIFGFEFFESNSFEQLCINYTNELLQQYFNTFIFENETNLYQEEGITWEPLDFPDNGVILDLLHEKLHGVLPMLEEECFHVGGSAESWYNKLVRLHGSHPNFTADKLKKGIFSISHFAGPVDYTVDAFLEKNKDHLSPDLLQCLKGSSEVFVTQRFLEHDRTFGTSTGTDGTQRVIKAQRYSVSNEFRQQLRDLLSQISSTTPHFVRCIKPNPMNRAFEDASADCPRPLFHRVSVAEQLSYQGVLAAIRVARAGFPVRYWHLDFLREFRCLAPAALRARMSTAMRGVESAAGCGESQAEKEVTEAVKEFLACEKVKALLDENSAQPPSGHRSKGLALGRMRIFMKQEPCNALRAARAELRHAAAAVLQAEQRKRLARKAYLTLCRGILRLQAIARGVSSRKALHHWRQERAATQLQAGLRTLAARLRLQQVRKVVLSVQSWDRGRRCKTQYLYSRAKLLQLQQWWRALKKRRRFRNLQQNVVTIQKAWRGHRGRQCALKFRAQLHWLSVAVARLVRIRRRNQTYREWRAQILQSYRGNPNVPEAAAKPHLIREILALRQLDSERRQAASRLYDENEDIREQIRELQQAACQRLRHWFNRLVWGGE